MGSTIEINDTLKLKRGPSLPQDLALNEAYTFVLPGRRLFHLQPTRVFLVEEIDGKWNHIGHAIILEQTIDAIRNETRGVYQITSFFILPTMSKCLTAMMPPPAKAMGCDTRLQ